MANTSHCLRPIFTKRLFEKLKDGDSINLVGKRGTGCDRTLADLSQMAREEGIPVLMMDMNEYKISPDAFSRAVWEQIHHRPMEIPGPAFPPASTTAVSIPQTNMPMQISEILARRDGKPAHLFLLLDNFHKLMDNRGQKFPRKFFDDLNSLKNRPHISIICVTEKSHLQYRIYIPNENPDNANNTSWLDLTFLKLSKLKTEEIKNELNRQLGQVDNWKKEQEKEIIIRGIKSHEHPLELLELLKTNYEFEDGNISAANRLQRTLNIYAREINKRPKKSLISFQDIKDVIKKILQNKAQLF